MPRKGMMEEERVPQEGDGRSDRFPAWLCPWSALRSCSRHVLVRNRKPAVFSLLVKVRCPWSCSLLTEGSLGCF